MNVAVVGLAVVQKTARLAGKGDNLLAQERM